MIVMVEGVKKLPDSSSAGVSVLAGAAELPTVACACRLIRIAWRRPRCFSFWFDQVTLGRGTLLGLMSACLFAGDSSDRRAGAAFAPPLPACRRSEVQVVGLGDMTLASGFVAKQSQAYCLTDN
jgi:hypothetical protein